MNKQKSDSFIIAILLLFSSGIFDAYSYIFRGGTFATLQTGNMILMCFNFVNRDFVKGLMYVIPIISFFIGSFIASLIELKLKNINFHWRLFIILIEIIVIVTAMFIKQGEYNFISNFLISFAAGAELQSFRKVRGLSVATTMCTGNLKNAGNSFAKAVFTHKKSYLYELILYLCLILCFILGALLIFLIIDYMNQYSISLALIPLIICFIIMIKSNDIKKSKSKQNIKNS